jgi:hypothetical protein
VLDTPLDAEAQIKLALMRAIDADLRRRYRTLAEAAEAIGTDAPMSLAWPCLSRLRHGHHRYFSIPWLLRLASAAHVHIRFKIDPVNR